MATWRQRWWLGLCLAALLGPRPGGGRAAPASAAAPFALRYRPALLPPPAAPDAPAVPYDRFHLCGSGGLLVTLQPLQPVYCQRLCNYSYPEEEMAAYVAAIKAPYRAALYLEGADGRRVDVVGGFPPSVKVGPDWQRTGQQLQPGYPIGLPGHQHGRGKTRINNHLAFDIAYRAGAGGVAVVNVTAVAHTYRHTAASCLADDRRNAAWRWDPLEQPLHQKVFPGQRVVYSFAVVWREVGTPAGPERAPPAAPSTPRHTVWLKERSETQQGDGTLPSAFLPFCPRVPPVPLHPFINVTCGVLCRATYDAAQMAALIALIKRDARATVTLGGVEAVEATESSTGSPTLLRGWPVGIRGHINGHHNARLNTHVALHAEVDAEDPARVLAVHAVPHSTRLSAQCSADDAANRRAGWRPDGAGPLAQRAAAGQPVAWTYAVTWAAVPRRERREPVPEPPVAPAAGRPRPPAPPPVAEPEPPPAEAEEAAAAAAAASAAPQGTAIPLSGAIVAVVAGANLFIFRRAWRQAHEVQQSRRQRATPG